MLAKSNFGRINSVELGWDIQVDGVWEWEWLWLVFAGPVVFFRLLTGCSLFGFLSRFGLVYFSHLLRFRLFHPSLLFVEFRRLFRTICYLSSFHFL